MADSILVRGNDYEFTLEMDGTYSDTVSRTQQGVDTSAFLADAAADLLPITADLGAFSAADFDESLSDTYTVNALATARGNPIYLPSGDVAVTLRSGYRWNRIESSDTRAFGGDVQLTRGQVFGGANISVPLTSRDEDFLDEIGDLTLNLNAGVEHLSDFGTLQDWTVGLTWGVTENLTVTANHINREVAPTLSQLGAPAIATPNVQLFDIANNESVLATVISGGNPDLPAQSQSDWTMGLIWELPFIDDATVSLDYFDNHSDDVTSGLPTLTPAIEAAFPDRVTRDITGQLVQLDDRFVTFAERDEKRLQFGLNLSGRIGGNDAGGGDRSGERSGRDSSAGAGGSGADRSRNPPNAERMEQMRAMFCEQEPDALLNLFSRALAAQAAGEEPPLGADGEPIIIPPRMLQRLAGDNGEIDPERFAAIRERICNAESAQAEGVTRQARSEGGRGSGRGGGRMNRLMNQNDDGPPTGRWFFNLDYTLELDSTVLIADGIPRLDLLDGDALSGGGEPRHGVRARGGVFYDGFGAIVFANYTGSSRLDGSGLVDSTDLFFDDYITFSLRAFADLGSRESLVEDVPFLEGSRVGLRLSNIFDARQSVVDSSGITPQSYQPFLVDPVGRSFEIEFRKMF